MRYFFSLYTLIWFIHTHSNPGADYSFRQTKQGADKQSKSSHSSSFIFLKRRTVLSEHASQGTFGQLLQRSGLWLLCRRRGKQPGPGQRRPQQRLQLRRRLWRSPFVFQKGQSQAKVSGTLPHPANFCVYSTTTGTSLILSLSAPQQEQNKSQSWKQLDQLDQPDQPSTPPGGPVRWPTRTTYCFTRADNSFTGLYNSGLLLT